MTASLATTALNYAKTLGWAVHPVDIEKKPTTKHGRNDATTDEPTIKAFFRNGAQIGVATGAESGLFVLDVDLDEKRGINGYETLEYLESIHGSLPKTPQQRTGRGGTQYLFKYQDGLKNSTGKIGAGIDTRGQGGYIVVAPSRNTNGPYTWVVSPREVPLADVPEWIIEALQKADEAERTPAGNAPGGEDRPYCLKMLGQAVAKCATAADGTKHDTLLKMATWMGGYVPAIAETEIEDSLWHAIALRSEDEQGARKTIRDGIAYGKSKPLSVPELRQPDTHIAGEPSEPLARALDAPRYELHTLKKLRALPPVTWLIDGEIPSGLTTIVCGPSGAGKSFLMVDYAMRIARANPDQFVVYIAPEGGNGYHMRADAWLDHFGGDEPSNLVFILQAITMLQPRAVDELITTIQPHKPVLVIFDTLARCLIGGDENSAKDVGMFFYHADLIRQATGSAIAIVHHTGKAGNFRGSSALYGSVESWIDVANDDGLITISCGKSKDAKPFPPRYLRMVEVAESVVLMPSDQVDQKNAPLSEGKRVILETLSLSIFRDVGAKRTEIVSATGINDRTIFKILSRMKQDGLISQSKKGDPYFISDHGLETIKSHHRNLRQSRHDKEVANSASTSADAPKSLPQVNQSDVDWLCDAANNADPTNEYSGIYEVLNTQNQKRYIGMTRKGFLVRWTEHIKELRFGKGITRHLNDDWKSFGETAFRFRAVEILSEDADYGERERYWIAVAQHCGSVYNINGATQVAPASNDHFSVGSGVTTQIAPIPTEQERQVAMSQSSSNSKNATSHQQVASSNDSRSLLETASCTTTSGRELKEQDELFPEDELSNIIGRGDND